MLVDCHAHLASKRFDADRDAVRRRAKEAGVGVVLVVGEDFEDSQRVLEVTAEPCDGGTELVPCVGLHPDRFAEDREPPGRREVEAIADLVRERREEIAAIGEVGLDRHWVKSEARRAAQAAFLEEMAALAVEVDLPLNVHSRAAGHYAIDLLLASGAPKVLMHAFDGKVAYAVKGAEAGFLFSIPPSAVRSEQKQAMIRKLPLESLALESDAPVLGPVRTERNEPANLTLTLDLMAEMHGVSKERVAEVTTANAKRLFPRLGQ